MTKKQAKALQPGDQVYWSDPDEGTCSRLLTICSIDFKEDGNVVEIMEPNGRVVECYVRELS